MIELTDRQSALTDIRRSTGSRLSDLVGPLQRSHPRLPPAAALLILSPNRSSLSAQQRLEDVSGLTAPVTLHQVALSWDDPAQTTREPSPGGRQRWRESPALAEARRKGGELRRELGLSGRVDAEAVANRLGLVVQPWPLRVLQGMQADDFIAVACRLDPYWRRWVTAHAVGRRLLHPGNHLRLQRHAAPVDAAEREAEEFASALLMDEREAREHSLVHPWEVAEYFGVPEERVQRRAPWNGERRRRVDGAPRAPGPPGSDTGEAS